jgi:beta-lactamase superfamily II metal-dependent hydrolase
MERRKLALVFLTASMLAAQVHVASATPPEYATYDREQRIQHTPDASRLMRIWAIYIGQGDSFLIQLPPAMSVGGERMDVLVDGGPNGEQLPLFLRQVYGDNGCVIEHAVLSHHDADHVAGLTRVLNRPEFALQRIYHNGLVSWLPSGRGFETLQLSSTGTAVFSTKKRQNEPEFIDRGMAFLATNGRDLRDADLIGSRQALGAALNANQLEGVYRDFAQAVVQKTTPQAVQSFNRADETAGTLPQFAAAGGASAVSLQQIWPKRPPRRYADQFGAWAYTINGNSVSFRLVYGDFEMLFTGDHNEASELDVLAELADAGVLRSDVLKVPHHGSGRSDKRFFDAVAPVISVASMGANTHGHPHANVVKWAGRAHRIYHTHIHERAFPQGNLDAATKEALKEQSHVLLETDGVWFRIVETKDPRVVPGVTSVARGNGTRWIKAR